MYKTGEDILKLCIQKSVSISEIVIMDEMENTLATREDIIKKLEDIYEVMNNAASYSLENSIKTLGGLIGGEGKKMIAYLNSSKSITDKWIIKAMARAFASSEYNASMGKICAAPTAGSCGILPAAIITCAEKNNLKKDIIMSGLLTASGIGKIISQNGTVSGAEGGCQAECGSAAAMAAGAMVEMLGGSPEESLTAAAISLKNVMGLICDPVGGLVESPCSKRNASGVVNAMISADMALSGIKSIIPFDEVVEAMKNVGQEMHQNFKETSKGGIAITETARRMFQK